MVSHSSHTIHDFLILVIRSINNNDNNNNNKKKKKKKKNDNNSNNISNNNNNNNNNFSKCYWKIRKNDIFCFHYFGGAIAAQNVICHPRVRKGVIKLQVIISKHKQNHLFQLQSNKLLPKKILKRTFFVLAILALFVPLKLLCDSKGVESCYKNAIDCM